MKRCFSLSHKPGGAGLNSYTITRFLGQHFTNLLQLALIGGTAWLAIYLLRKVSSRSRASLEAIEDAGRQARLKTLLQVSTSIASGAVLFFAGFATLALLGINLAPVVASVGVIGLAVSLGAQALIKDYIGGFYILVENQFTVGDEITVQQVTGTVERISMRATWVRDFSGRLYTIPNSEVRIVANFSRSWARAIVDFNFAHSEDIRPVVALLQQAVRQAAEDPEMQPILLEEPLVAGWTNLTPWATQIRVTARTQAGKQRAAEVLLRKYALDELNRAGIQLVVPPAPAA